MKRDYKLRIQDILDSMNLIENYIKGKSENDFYEDFEIQDAVMRRLEIIGEATKHIPVVVREKYPEVPWKKMAGLRDVAIHDYSDIVTERIWSTVVLAIPKTKKQIEKVKKDIEALINSI
ncbi:MAG: hypothetical protein ACD_12C00206G0012 [uncultured bacterium]|nr:MAG: hypothetical protein ACD_12C00206G0012 [uncultured bacterium]